MNKIHYLLLIIIIFINCSSTVVPIIDLENDYKIKGDTIHIRGVEYYALKINEVMNIRQNDYGISIRIIKNVFLINIPCRNSKELYLKLKFDIHNYRKKIFKVKN